ncbi:MAG: hypothetical protein IT459_11580 [Planctomycetes bacterium]|nr:hypothetical protein [Planctomycetota bacterium]
MTRSVRNGLLIGVALTLATLGAWWLARARAPRDPTIDGGRPHAIASIERALAAAPAAAPFEVERVVNSAVAAPAVRVPNEPPRFRLRIVDAATKRPVEGAEVLPLPAHAQTIPEFDDAPRSDSHGVVTVDPRGWEAPEALVRARGYGLLAIPIKRDRGPYTVDVELEPCGVLIVDIDARAALLADLRLEVEFAREAIGAAYPRVKRKGGLRAVLEIDETLHAEFDSPPPRAELRVVAEFRPCGGATRTVTIDAHERREVRFDFQRPGVVAGRVSADRKSLAGVEVVLGRFADIRSSIPCVEDRERPRLVDPAPRRMLTDAAGEFRFEDVPIGIWSLSSDPRSLAAAASTAAPSVAGVHPAFVRVFGDGGARYVNLTATVGWMVTGRVLDHRARPIPGALVSWNRPGLHFGAHETTDAAGDFVLGPFTAQRIRVVARYAPSDDQGDARSDERWIDRSLAASSVPVELTGATTGLGLRMPRGGQISGNLAAAPGSQPSTATFVLCAGREHVDLCYSETPPHHFAFRNLPPGKYRIFAIAHDPTDAMTIGPVIELAEGATIEGLGLELHPPARVRFETGGATLPLRVCRSYELEVGGIAFEQTVGMSNENDVVEIPAGRFLLIELRENAAGEFERTPVGEFDVAPGETRVVTIEE